MASDGDVRKAGKRGTWYTYDKKTLSDEIDAWLDKVPNTINGHDLPIQGARVIIAPHAGYAYSGACAAWAYKTLDLRGIKRVFLLGPSHTYYLAGPAVTRYTSYDTPFGALQVDAEVVAALRATGKTSDIKKSSDSAEHSLEMHLPYLYKRLQQTFASPAEYPTIVPVLIGDGKAAAEKDTARLLLPYLRDRANAFIVSSDFCHWGRGFSYMPYLATGDLDSITQVSMGGGGRRYADPPIHEGIRVLDEAAFAAIETGSHDAFVAYLRKTENTVCGRHPIGVVMAALEMLAEDNPGAAAAATTDAGEAGSDERQKGKGKFTFIQYQRSELVEMPGDTSVSYAAAYTIV